jgi:hypothetical protein
MGQRIRQRTEGLAEGFAYRAGRPLGGYFSAGLPQKSGSGVISLTHNRTLDKNSPLDDWQAFQPITKTLATFYIPLSVQQLLQLVRSDACCAQIIVLNAGVMVSIPIGGNREGRRLIVNQNFECAASHYPSSLVASHFRVKTRVNFHGRQRAFDQIEGKPLVAYQQRGQLKELQCHALYCARVSASIRRHEYPPRDLHHTVPYIHLPPSYATGQPAMCVPGSFQLSCRRTFIQSLRWLTYRMKC